MLVAEARHPIDEAERQAGRAERKLELMNLARVILAAVLNECPRHLVGAQNSDQRRHTTRAVWADLRVILDKALLGTESPGDLRQHVEEHVARWQTVHHRWWRPRLPSPQKVLKGLERAKAIVDVVNQTPELRQLADTVTQAVLARLRERRSPKDPPTAPS